MTSPWPGSYTLKIKNIGDEPLTNIYVTQTFGNYPLSFGFTTIPTLAPGQEITNLSASSGATCFDVSQAMVHATTTGGSEITDLSADPNYYVSPGYGTYYNDSYTTSYYQSYATAVQQGTYQDLNNNSIVDVGDAVFYTYSMNSSEYPNQIDINDDNAVVSNITYSGFETTASGIHYITQNEVNSGYVYNNSYVSYLDYCQINNTIEFTDESQCYLCPNPNYANVITKLNDLGPHTITGNVKLNLNNDNCTTGINFPYRRVTNDNGQDIYTTFTNTNGNYQIIVPNMGINNDLVATNGLNNAFTSNPASINFWTYNSPNPINYGNNDFCLSPTTNYSDLSVSMHNVNQAIPGNTAGYYISFWNNGTTNLSGSIVLTFDNGKLTFNNASPAQNSTTANTLIWNYTNLQPFEHHNIALTFNVLTPPTVNVNDLLNFTVVANPIAGDNTPTNNTFSWEQTVRSSFDPNDKTVIEGEYITTAEANNYLTYVTRFQNNGTANATTVVIKEMLDAKLDWNTFEPISSSHQANIQLKNGNDLTYTFSNIDLPYESANEPASHGWMAYRIKPKSDFAIGDIASSNSNIYFDYNQPILTNTVTTEMVALEIPDNIKDNFILYPNPAADYLTIEMVHPMNAYYKIFDINGKLLQSNAIENMRPIDLSIFQSGFYFLTIQTWRGSANYKLIKI